MSIDSFVQQNATACAYLASLSDTLNTPTPSGRPFLPHQASPSTPLLFLDQLLNGSGTNANVPVVYKTCLSECILGTTDFDAVLIGLSDLLPSNVTAHTGTWQHLAGSSVVVCMLLDLHC